MPITVPLTTSRTERTMTTTTAHQLQQIARHWPDLTDALEVPTAGTGFGLGLRGYLNTLEQHDAAEQAALRAMERNPDQLGATAAPLSLRIADTMRTVEVALHETGTQIAAANQRALITPAPRDWAKDDRARRNKIALEDSRDRQRWHFTPSHTAPYSALWLCARVQGAKWPGTGLTTAQHATVRKVAAGALERIEKALDLVYQRRELSIDRPCQCGGRIEVYGGGGADPVAQCQGCGAFWSERGILAA
ncbi:hypothetical protein ACFQ9J_28505 [Streptomyces sp. NPDC056529]|uniref:hypothetical protein n=1 Tax=Streptomyces sp. NPDC056529 TaxID=3345855 RepID=UPI003674F56E